jgi:hypothetical protein
MWQITVLTPLSLLISCKLSFPIVGLLTENMSEQGWSAEKRKYRGGMVLNSG